ncbi:hypothetical protein ACFV1G_07760 [Streptomyces anulatus]|uniref:hypothetical protein n=1 Tax=Streptomyces TaxID=1883 RepID=UPI000B420E01|nr:hypothetical protein [Streptomyces sp. CS057]OWA20645.1 hypothetical protein B9W61_24480 [Streptomyces sp. CS057]
MSDSEPVILEGIPVFTGDLALLDTKVSALAEDGAKIATAAGDIHSSFGGLQAFYTAPEADQLFATTKPVADRGAALKSDLATITGALGTYSNDAYPLVEKLRQLKRDAGAFLVKANADDDWREDGDLVEENNRRRDEIAETWAAFQAVERACYNKIISLVPHGTPLGTDDGSGRKGMYGYDAAALKQAKGLPWGDPVKESTPWYHVHEHTWDFVKGFAVDGVWATVKGLGTLTGFDGWDAAKQAWTGLGNLTTGVILTIAAPHVLWLTPEDKLPGFARDARRAMTETGKALIAYDQWGENPARAGGAVTFNVLTTVFTGGAGGGVSGAGKAAVAAKALSFANKAGRFVDPTTYLFKGASTGLTKISDVMAGLRGTGNIEIPPLPNTVFTLPEGGIRLSDGTVSLPEGAAIPEGAVKLPDGTIKLPDGVIALPEGTVRSPLDHGPAYMGREGNLYNEDGSIAQRAEDATHEKSPEESPSRTAPRFDTSVKVEFRSRELAGIGRSGDDTARLGSDISDPVQAVDDSTLGSRHGNHPDDLPNTLSASNEQPAGHESGSSSHHDGSRGGYNGASADSVYERPANEHSSTPGSGPGSDGGADPGGPSNPASGSSGTHGWERRAGEGAPFVRGGDIEQQIHDQLRRSGVKRDDLERVLTNLAGHPAGREVATTIVSGRFKTSAHFDQVISMLSHADKMSGSVEQIRLANRIYDSGIRDISFEIKGNIEIKPGVRTGDLTDLDVMARDANGDIHGYQFKEVKSPKKVVQKIFDNMKQLDRSGADFKTFVVDTKGTLAEHMTFRTQQRLTETYGKTKIQFIIRVEDGILIIPPNGTFMPEAAL